MKKALFTAAVILFASNLCAQSLYDSVNYRQDRISKTSLTILSGWSLASLASGIIGQNNSSGEVKAFHNRNILWGGINLGLSGIGLLRLRSEINKQYSPAETFKRAATVQKVFLFNTGLDLAYVGLALYTRERAGRFSGDKHDRLRGTGSSLLMQGVFLSLFDGVLYFLHSKNGNHLDVKLQNLNFIAAPGGLGLAYRF